jgi:hypothetical protein
MRGPELGAERIEGAGSTCSFAEEFCESAFSETELSDAAFDAKLFSPASGEAIVCFARPPGERLFLAPLAAGRMGFVLSEDELGMAIFFGVDEAHHSAVDRDAMASAETAAAQRGALTRNPHARGDGRWHECDAERHKKQRARRGNKFAANWHDRASSLEKR